MTTIAPLRIDGGLRGPCERHLPRDLVGDRAGQTRARRDQDGPRVHVVFGLREQIGGDPAGRPFADTIRISLGPAKKSMAQSAETSALAAAT